MPIKRYIKAPGEVKRYSADYNNWLDTGETLSDLQFAITPVTASPLTVGSIVFEPDSRAGQFLVSGGLAGTVYEVIMTAITSGNQTKKDLILYDLRDVQ